MADQSKEKVNMEYFSVCATFTVCARCTAARAVLSSTDHRSDISHLLPLETTSTETFLSHLLFVKVSTELCHLWAGCHTRAGHISQAVNFAVKHQQPAHLSRGTWSSSQSQCHSWLATESHQACDDSHGFQSDSGTLCMHTLCAEGTVLIVQSNIPNNNSLESSFFFNSESSIWSKKHKHPSFFNTACSQVLYE